MAVLRTDDNQLHQLDPIIGETANDVKTALNAASHDGISVIAGRRFLQKEDGTLLAWDHVVEVLDDNVTPGVKVARSRNQ